LAEYLGLLGEVEPEDGARIALAVKRAYQDPLEALSLSAAAQALKGVGLEGDVPFAAQVAKSAAVPILSGRVGDALIFKRAY
jgi:2-phosphosulfolactate phosphatase